MQNIFVHSVVLYQLHVCLLCVYTTTASLIVCVLRRLMYLYGDRTQRAANTQVCGLDTHARIILRNSTSPNRTNKHTLAHRRPTLSLALDTLTINIEGNRARSAPCVRPQSASRRTRHITRITRAWLVCVCAWSPNV